MKRCLAAGMIAALALCPLSAMADSQQQPQKDPEALASEGLQSLLEAMRMMLMAIPQYEAPYVNERGDIIIRRKNPPKEQPEPAHPGSKPDGKAI